MPVVIVLEQFAQQQEIERGGVFWFIFIIKISVPVFMPAPVNDSAVYRPHHKMDRQQ